MLYGESGTGKSTFAATYSEAARVEQLEKYINQDDISPELAEELARIVVDKEY